MSDANSQRPATVLSGKLPVWLLAYIKKENGGENYDRRTNLLRLSKRNHFPDNA